MSELKPCPFCGGKASKMLNGNEDNYFWWVECCECHATIDSFVISTEAIAAWNIRAERTCHNTSHRLDESRFHCSECEFGCWVKDVADGHDKLPNYCPNCGAKVVNK